MTLPTLPTREPGWATDGAAIVTDPGTSKQDTGFVTGEAPAADHVNWLLNQQGAWLETLAASNAGMIAAKRMRQTDSDPFNDGGGTLWQSYTVYDDLGDHWYHSYIEGTGGDYYAYDSADGQTWTAGKLVDTVVGASRSCARVVTNGTLCATAADATFYLSTDLTAANLASKGTFNSITLVRDVGYSTQSSKWLATGWNSTNGYIESSTDGITWAVEYSGGASWYGESMEIARTGVLTSSSGERIICTNSNDDDISYSDDGGLTWTPDTATTSAEYLRAVQWCPSFNRWIGIRDDGASDFFLYVSTTTGGLAYTTDAVPMSAIAVTDTAVFVFPDGAATMQEVTFADGVGISYGPVITLGSDMRPLLADEGGSGSVRTLIRGNRGSFGYPRIDGDYVFTDFRPQV